MWTGTDYTDPGVLQWVVVISMAAIAAVIDVRSRRIPNRLTGPMCLGGLLFAAVAWGSAGLGYSLLGTVLVALPFVLIWLLKGSGAADAKMMGAVGAWLGLEMGLVALLAVAVAGGVLAIAWAIARGHLCTSLVNLRYLMISWIYVLQGPGAMSQRLEAVPQFGTTRMPYGLAIFLGVCAAGVWRLL